MTTGALQKGPLHRRMGDKATPGSDGAGAVERRLEEAIGHLVTERDVVVDVAGRLEENVLAAQPQLVITSGGTGISPTDRTATITAAAKTEVEYLLSRVARVDKRANLQPQASAAE